MEKVYLVLQGNMNSCDNGQLYVIEWFNDYKAAFKFMQSIYNDVNGYNKHPNGYLLTQVVDIEKDPLSDDYIISEMKFYY